MFILIFKISDLSYLVHLSFFSRRAPRRPAPRRPAPRRRAPRRRAPRRRAPRRRAPRRRAPRPLTKNFYINIQKI